MSDIRPITHEDYAEEAEAAVRVAHGPHNEWVQLNDTPDGPNVKPGYSGAGVADGGTRPARGLAPHLRVCRGVGRPHRVAFAT